MPYNHIEIQPMTGRFGAEISGVDLSTSLEDDVFEEIKRAWLEYRLIFLRDQEMTPANQRDFAGRFGGFQKPGTVPTLEGYPEVRRQETTPNSFSKNIGWHTDDSFLEFPSKGSVLYSLKVPSAGGDTVWSDLTAAYEALSDRMQRMLEGLVAVHDISANSALKTIELLGPENFSKFRKSMPPVEHPLVRTHPETGLKSLFVNQQLVSHIKDLTEKESFALLQLLFRHTQEEEFLCRFKWRDNSVAFWDNRCTQHRGIFDFSGEEPRLMHRVAIAESDRPI
jgi:taurine dioxygenase